MPTSLISGIGVYTPAKEVSMRERESLPGRRLRIPIQRVTGIRSVRVAEEGDFAIEMARKAAERCLISAGVLASEIDLLISCSIGRHDKPDLGHVFEPCSAFRLKQMLGTDGAQAFDVSNACAGLVTGMLVADTFIQSGRASRALVVSGEFISHLAETAAKEIVGLSDSRMACLTLGDGAAAVLMTPAAEGLCGFADMKIYSLPDHSELCVAEPTPEPHGGVVMKTNSAELSRVMIEELRQHVPSFLRGAGRTGACVDWVIPHQTSKTTIRDAAKAINASLGFPLCTTESVLLGLEKYGNTASTSHILALHENILNGKICDGDAALFSVNASGLTVGSALYTFDDLPSRVREGRSRSVDLMPKQPRAIGGARIVGATFELGPASMVRRKAVESALAQANISPTEVDLLLYAGVYRDGFVLEPCLATLIAKDCGLGLGSNENFLAFDVFAGPSGLLHALSIAGEMIGTGKKRNVVIVAGDEDPNLRRGKPLGILSSSGVMVLQSGGPAAKKPKVSSVPLTGCLSRFTKQEHGEMFIVSEGKSPCCCGQGDRMEEALIDSLTGHRPDLVLASGDSWLPVLIDRFGLRSDEIVMPNLEGTAFSADLIAAWCRALSEGKLRSGGTALFLGYSDIGEATALLHEM